MPWFDRTGPVGLGPLTGRGRGLCLGDITIDEQEGRTYPADRHGYTEFVGRLMEKTWDNLAQKLNSIPSPVARAIKRYEFLDPLAAASKLWWKYHLKFIAAGALAPEEVVHWREKVIGQLLEMCKRTGVCVENLRWGWLEHEPSPEPEPSPAPEPATGPEPSTAPAAAESWLQRNMKTVLLVSALVPVSLIVLWRTKGESHV